MASSMWWFFSLLVTSSYTANLAAFLTKKNLGPTIDTAEDLSKQSKIKYGLMDGGSTYTFFKSSNYSTFKKMFTQMSGLVLLNEVVIDYFQSPIVVGSNRAFLRTKTPTE